MTDHHIQQLQDELESMWRKYLDHLDRYDKAQKTIAEHLNSGFFSLAQANFKNINRTRYGQDYYDDRMKASRHVRYISQDQERMIKTTVSSSNDCEIAAQQILSAQQASTMATPATDPEKESKATLNTSNAETYQSAEPETTSTEPPAKRRDPTAWFGLLVPPQLRSCQRSFVAAIEDPVAEAVDAARSMRSVEIDIRRLRKSIDKQGKGSTVPTQSINGIAQAIIS